MNKIRKPGEHPGKGRIPGVRPISIKEIRNKKRMERYMSDTVGFISEKLQRVEEEYGTSTDLFSVLRTINKIAIEHATQSVSQVNAVDGLEEKISILHQCVITIVSMLEKTEQNANMQLLKYRHEVSLLKSMAAELNNFVEQQDGEPFEMPLQDEEEPSIGEKENDAAEETLEEAVE